MRVIALALAVVAVAGLLWIGGEIHRENCVRQGKISCSDLPWDAGERSGGKGGRYQFGTP
jgi:hypothetical protein